MSVLIATPCYGGQLSVPAYRSLTAICQAIPDADLLVTEGESNVNRARNSAAATFHKGDWDTLAFIDADIEMYPQDFVKLLAIDAPIRGAAVAMKTQDGSEALSCWVDTNSAHIERYKRGEGQVPFECRYLGSAVMLIEREVIEKFYGIPDLLYDDDVLGECADIFRCAVVNRTYLTEDYGFCYWAQRAGFNIVCDPSIIVAHYGQGVWAY